MIPENEMGVIVLFSNLCEKYGFDVLSIQASFPDAVIAKNGVIYRVEFEFLSSNFINHKHDYRSCDLVICWKHDASDFALPVIELANPFWMNEEIVIQSDANKEIAYWKQRAVIAERALIERESVKPAREKQKNILRCQGCDKIFYTQNSLNAHSRFHKAKVVGYVAEFTPITKEGKKHV